MAWKTYRDKWPNGRAFWTVEDRDSKPRQIRIGMKGGITRYHDHEMAKAERDRLNGKQRPNIFSVVDDDSTAIAEGRT